MFNLLWFCVGFDSFGVSLACTLLGINNGDGRVFLVGEWSFASFRTGKLTSTGSGDFNCTFAPGVSLYSCLFNSCFLVASGSVELTGPSLGLSLLVGATLWFLGNSSFVLLSKCFEPSLAFAGCTGTLVGVFSVKLSFSLWPTGMTDGLFFGVVVVALVIVDVGVEIPLDWMPLRETGVPTSMRNQFHFIKAFLMTCLAVAVHWHVWKHFSDSQCHVSDTAVPCAVTFYTYMKAALLSSQLQHNLSTNYIFRVLPYSHLSLLQITINYCYYEHPLDHNVVSAIARVFSSGSYIQSLLSHWGFVSCP